MLLEKMDPNPREENGLTPLDLALGDGNMLAVKHLMNAGGSSPKFKFFDDQITSNGRTVLHAHDQGPKEIEWKMERKRKEELHLKRIGTPQRPSSHREKVIEA